MTLRAIQRGVFTLQPECTLLMGFLGEQSWLEHGLGMACGTVRPCGTGCELVLVHILMAIAAQFMGDGPAIIAVLMTLHTGCLRVLAV